MKENCTQIHVTYGLPGSGKTYWSSKKVADRYIDLDKYAVGKTTTFDEWATDIIYDIIHGTCCNVVIIDGLITTHKALGSVLRAAIDGEGDKKRKITITTHVWNEDRETCIYNDRLRRKTSSQLSIKNMVYEPITGIEDIWKAVGNDYVAKAEFLYERHFVHAKPEYKKWFESVLGMDMGESYVSFSDKPFISHDKIVSDEWSLGGEFGTYQGDMGYVSAENPVKFTELYDLLLRINNDIPYRVVKKVEDCIKVEKRHQSDYYSGGVDYAHYEVSCEDIFNIICEWKNEKSRKKQNDNCL